MSIESGNALGLFNFKISIRHVNFEIFIHIQMKLFTCRKKNFLISIVMDAGFKRK